MWSAGTTFGSFAIQPMQSAIHGVGELTRTCAKISIYVLTVQFTDIYKLALCQSV